MVVIGSGTMLLAVVLFLANSVLAWHERWLSTSFGAIATPLGATLLLAGGLLLMLALAIGRRSKAALWTLGGVAGLLVISTVWRAVAGTLPGGAVGIAAVVDALLAMAAIVLLAVRSARMWFQEKAI